MTCRPGVFNKWLGVLINFDFQCNLYFIIKIKQAINAFTLHGGRKMKKIDFKTIEDLWYRRWRHFYFVDVSHYFWTMLSSRFLVILVNKGSHFITTLLTIVRLNLRYHLRSNFQKHVKFIDLYEKFFSVYSMWKISPRFWNKPHSHIGLYSIKKLIYHFNICFV